MRFSPVTSLRNLMRRQAQVQWALVDQGLCSGVNFATAIIVARNLGLEEFGRFSLAWIVALFFSNLQIATVCIPMMGIGPKQSAQQRPQYFATLAAQQALFSAVTFCAIFLMVPLAHVLFQDPHLYGVGLPLATAAVAFQAQDFIRRYFITRGDTELALVNDVISYGGQLVVLLWLFSTRDGDAKAVLWVIAATSGLAFAVGSLRMEKLHFDLVSFREISRRQWRSARWMGGTAIMNWLSSNTFLVAAGAMLGVASVGLLQAAEKIVNVLNILFQALGNIIPVEAARLLRDGNSGKLTAYLKKVTLAGGAVTVAVALLLSVFPETWLRLAYGNQMAQMGSILSGYAAVYVAMFLSIPLRSGLIATENTRPIFIAYLLQTVFAAVSAYQLIQWLGIWGVPAGLMVKQLISFALLSFAYARSSPVPATSDPERLAVEREYRD